MFGKKDLEEGISHKNANYWFFVLSMCILVPPSVLLAVLALPAALIAVLVYMGTRSLLSSRQWLLVAIAAAAGLVLTFKVSSLSYLVWAVKLWSSATGWVPDFVERSNATFMPPPAFFAMTGLMTALLGALTSTGSGIGSIDPSRIPRPKVSSRTSVVPKDHDKLRERLKRLPAPLDYVPKGDDNKKTPPAPPGKRSFAMGRTVGRRLVMLNEKDCATHGVVLGSTGSGKSVSLMWLAGALLDMGMDGCVIDLKEDTQEDGLRDFLRGYAMVNNTPYQDLALSDETTRWWFNSFQGMGADEAREALLYSTDFDDNYHQNMCRKIMGQTLNLLFESHEVAPERYSPPSMLELGRELELLEGGGTLRERIAVVASVRGADYARDTYPALYDGVQQELRAEGKSFGLRITNLYDSTAGRTILRPSKTPDGVDRVPLDVTRPGITYIGLSAAAQHETAVTLSSMVLKRFAVMGAHVSTGRATRRPRFLIIDEANVINVGLVKELLSRCRSAGIMVFLATQGANDWITPENGDAWVDISNNVTVGLFLRAGSPESAELAAQYIGTDRMIQTTQRVDDGEVVNSGSVSLKEDFRVHPRELRNFDSGEAILSLPRSKPVWLQMPMRTEELNTYKAAGRPVPTTRGTFA